MTEIDRALTNRRLGARARRNRPAGRWLRQHNTGEPGERRGGRKPGTPNKPKGERAVIALEQAEGEVPASSGESPVPVGGAHEPQRADCLAGHVGLEVRRETGKE